MAKLLKIRKHVHLPAGATGGTWEAEYDHAYLTAWGLSGGVYRGPLSGPDVLDPAKIGLALLFAEGTEGKPVEERLARLHGAEAGDYLPGVVRLTIFPTGGDKHFPSYTITGQPRDTGNGEWDLTQVGESAGRDVFVTPELQADVVSLIGEGRQVVADARATNTQNAVSISAARSAADRAHAALILSGEAMQVRDDYLNLVAGESILPTQLALPWRTGGATLSIAPSPGLAPQANAHTLTCAGGPQRWALVDNDLPVVEAGIYRRRLILTSAPAAEQQLTILARVQGTEGNEKAILAQINI